jgi:hypothetical protein
MTAARMVKEMKGKKGVEERKNSIVDSGLSKICCKGEGICTDGGARC